MIVSNVQAWVSCDVRGCGELYEIDGESDVDHAEHKALMRAEADGWSTVDGHHFCPLHAKEHTDGQE